MTETAAPASSQKRKPTWLVVALLSALLVSYALYVKGKSRHLQAQQIRLLGSSAEHVEEVLETVLESVSNLSRDLKPETLDGFRARQPFLRLMSGPPPGAQVEVIQPRPTSPGENDGDTGGTSAQFVPAARGLRIRLGPLARTGAQLEVKQPAGAIVGSLFGTSDTTATVSDGNLILTQVDERISVAAPLKGSIDPGANRKELVHEIPLKQEDLALSSGAVTIKSTQADDLYIPWSRVFNREVQAIEFENQPVYSGRDVLTFSSVREIIATVAMTSDRSRELGLDRARGDVPVTWEPECRVRDGKSVLFRLAPEQIEALSLGRAGVASDLRARLTRPKFFEPKLTIEATRMKVELLEEQQEYAVEPTRKVMVLCGQAPALMSKAGKPVWLEGEARKSVERFVEKYRAGRGDIVASEKTRDGAPILELSYPVANLEVPLGVDAGVEIEKAESAGRNLWVKLKKPASLRAPLSNEEERQLSRVLARDWRHPVTARLLRQSERRWQLEVSSTKKHAKLTLPLVDKAAPTPFEAAQPGLRSDYSSGILVVRVEGEQAAPPIVFDVLLGPILEKLPLERHFESYMVADSTKRVLFTQRRPGASDLNLRALGQLDTFATAVKADKPKSDDASGFIELLGLGELDYELFCQPIRISNSHSWSEGGKGALDLELCGLSDQGESRRAAFSFSPLFAGLVVMLTALAILSLPFLRFVALGPEERLRLNEVVLLIVGTFLALFSVSIVLTGGHRNIDLKFAMDEQLRGLATEVDSRFETSLSAARQQLSKWDREICDSDKYHRGWADRPPQDTDLLLTDGRTRAEIGLTTLVPDELSRFQAVHWVNHEGEQIAKGTTYTSNTPVVQVREREYFRAIVEGRAWTTAETPFFFQPIRSITTGELSAALSIKSAVSPGDAESRATRRAEETTCAGRASDTVVAVLEGMPPPLDAPVVTPPFGFAIIDGQGNVQFHSDPRQPGLQSLFDQLSSADRLSSILLAGKRPPPPFESDYLGRPHRFYVEKLTSVPWWVVTYHSAELPSTLLVETFLIALVPGGLYIFLMLGIVYWQRRSLREALWPDERKTDKYSRLLAVVVVACAVLLLSRFQSPGLVPVALAPFVAAVVPAAVLLWILKQLGRESMESVATNDQLPSNSSEPRRHPAPWQFTAGFVGIWLMTAALPALVFFETAWQVELATLARYQARADSDAREARDGRTRQRLLRVNTSELRGQDENNFSAASVYRLPTGSHLLRDRLPSPQSRRQLLTQSVWLGRLSRSWAIYNSASRDLRYEVGERTSDAMDPFDDTAPGAIHPAHTGWRGEMRHRGVALLIWLVVVAVVWRWVVYLARGICFANVARTKGKSVEQLLEQEANMTAVVTTPEQEREFFDKWKQALVWKLEEEPPGTAQLSKDTPILVRGFEELLHDATKRAERRQQLRELLDAETGPIVLLSYAAPEELLEEILPAADDGPGGELRQWWDLLSRLEPQFVALGPKAEVKSYYQLWTGLSRHEQLALLHIAEEKFLNRQMRPVAQMLWQRGLLDDGTRLVLRPGLQEFVRTHKAVRATRDYDSGATESGLKRWRPAMVLTLVGVAAFFFVMQEGLLVNLVAGVTGAGGMVAAAIRLVDVFGKSRG